MNPDPEARDKLLNDLSSTLSPASEPVAASLPKPPVIPDHELVRRIGRGSYGEVWLARNALGTWRAVKVVYVPRSITSVRTTVSSKAFAASSRSPARTPAN